LFFFLVHKEKRNIRGLHLLFVCLKKEMRKTLKKGPRKRDRKKNDDKEEKDKYG
jgi:hypothetical protein